MIHIILIKISLCFLNKKESYSIESHTTLFVKHLNKARRIMSINQQSIKELLTVPPCFINKKESYRNESHTALYVKHIQVRQDT